MMDNEIFATVNAHAERAARQRQMLKALDRSNRAKADRAGRFLRDHWEKVAMRRAVRTVALEAALAGLSLAAVLVIALCAVMGR